MCCKIKKKKDLSFTLVSKYLLTDILGMDKWYQGKGDTVWGGKFLALWGAAMEERKMGMGVKWTFLLILT